MSEKIADVIKEISAIANEENRDLLVIGKRLCWAGRVKTIYDDCIVLINAFIVNDISDICDNEHNYNIQAQIPEGVVMLTFSSIESVLIGKKNTNRHYI